MTVKEFLEVTMLVLGGAGGAATAGYAFAIWQAKQEIDSLKSDIKDIQTDLRHSQTAFELRLQKSISGGQLEFARKVQQNINANMVDLGTVKCDIKDIKGVLEREMNMKKRPPFPEENKPQHTDFNKL